MHFAYLSSALMWYDYIMLVIREENPVIPMLKTILPKTNPD